MTLSMVISIDWWNNQVVITSNPLKFRDWMITSRMCFCNIINNKAKWKLFSSTRPLPISHHWFEMRYIFRPFCTSFKVIPANFLSAHCNTILSCICNAQYPPNLKSKRCCKLQQTPHYTLKGMGAQFQCVYLECVNIGNENKSAQFCVF